MTDVIIQLTMNPPSEREITPDLCQSVYQAIRLRGTHTGNAHPSQPNNETKLFAVPIIGMQLFPGGTTETVQSFGTSAVNVERLRVEPVISHDSLIAEINLWLRSLSKSTEDKPPREGFRRISADNWLQSLYEQGKKDLADRLALLRSISDDEDDAPLTDEAMLGFMGFLADVQFSGTRMSLTSAHGWLCTEWEYEDGRSLVLWFKNQIDTTIVAFGDDGKIIKHLGRHPSAGDRHRATELLTDEGFFSRRS